MAEDHDKTGAAAAPRRLLRSAAKPVTGYLDQRIGDLHRHVDHRADVLEQHIEALRDEVRRVGSSERLDALAQTAQALQELTDTIRLFAERFAGQAGEIADAFAELLDRAGCLEAGTAAEEAEPPGESTT